MDIPKFPDDWTGDNPDDWTGDNRMSKVEDTLFKWLGSEYMGWVKARSLKLSNYI